jgi:peptidoglycan/xylan/chitin deacetylase (PgdA/CDA1 family)
VTEGARRRPRRRPRAYRSAAALVAVPLGVAASTAAVGGAAGDGSGKGASERRAAETVRTLPTKKKVVALTFDAGSDEGYTKLILKVLRREKVKASFGITGRWIEENRKLTRRIAKRGHTIINHTYSHSSWTGLSAGSGLSGAARRRELKRTDRLVRKFTDVRTKPWFRPPYGDFDASALRLLANRGYRYNVLWTVDSGGTVGLSAGAILQRCLDGLRRGAIYLMHVGSQSQDGPALEPLINQLKKRGYDFATIREELPP